MTDKTKYEATFVISQEGSDGEVVSKLKFSPLMEGDAEAPVCYELMAYLVQEYLHVTGVIDDNGELIDPEAFHDNTVLDVSNVRGKLN